MSDIEKLKLKMKRQLNKVRFKEGTKVLEYSGYKMKVENIFMQEC